MSPLSVGEREIVEGCVVLFDTERDRVGVRLIALHDDVGWLTAAPDAADNLRQELERSFR